ncbi:MAG: NAD(P)-binding domain-containing protein [Woeseiaceae bacterium]|nr:NAD(P)-binding domain-containing protein [Woeseiaceae bacterium]
MPRRSNGNAARNTDVVVIGAGHAGLSFSHYLAESSIDHVVLERGEIANSWRTERWDSLTLLTPNWQCKVPGFSYSGDDPDGFMTVPELVGFIDDYAQATSAPVRTHTPVNSVRPDDGRYRVITSDGAWRCRAVIVASGACNIPSVPKVEAFVPEGIHTLTPHQYRSPADLDDGGVMVVGASATGLQLAEEILQSGRKVTIATGEHVRMPRRYRGHDIFWWLDKVGISNERYDELDDIGRARRLPSPQLVGTPDNRTLDLNAMLDQGAALVGRLMGFNGRVAQFSGSLKNVCALADLKMNRMLKNIDEWLEENDDPSAYPAPERYEFTRVAESPPLTLDLDKQNIRTILWATGFRPDYSWLEVPVLNSKGMIRHDGGVSEAPGLYVIGLPVLRRRKSSFIHGIEDDARDLHEHLLSYLHS